MIEMIVVRLNKREPVVSPLYLCVTVGTEEEDRAFQERCLDSQLQSPQRQDSAGQAKSGHCGASVPLPQQHGKEDLFPTLVCDAHALCGRICSHKACSSESLRSEGIVISKCSTDAW